MHVIYRHERLSGCKPASARYGSQRLSRIRTRIRSYAPVLGAGIVSSLTILPGNCIFIINQVVSKTHVTNYTLGRQGHKRRHHTLLGCMAVALHGGY